MAVYDVSPEAADWDAPNLMEESQLFVIADFDEEDFDDDFDDDFKEEEDDGYTLQLEENWETDVIKSQSEDEPGR